MMCVQRLAKMKHFINLKDISTKDLRKIINDAQRRKNLKQKKFLSKFPKKYKV